MYVCMYVCMYGDGKYIGFETGAEMTTIIVDIFDTIQQVRDTGIQLKVDEEQMEDHTRKYVCMYVCMIVVVVVFTLKAVPISTQYFLTSVLVQLTRTPSVVTG